MRERQEKEFMIRERIMVIVPHQDDEILMTAGVIREAVKKGMSVTVVMATNGDCGGSDYSVGRARLAESVKGLQMLGLESGHFQMLGYADTGMPKEESFLYHLYHESDEKKIYPSSCSARTYGLPEKDEFHMQRYGEHADYCRRCFKDDLREIIEKEKPQQIFTTSEFDIHGDHSALYRFVCEVLDEMREEAGPGKCQGEGTDRYQGAAADGHQGADEYDKGVLPYAPELYTGIVHSPVGDENWPLRGTALFSCPEDFEQETGLRWEERIRLQLPEEMQTARGTKNLKYRALLQYETALEPNAVEFLMSFIKDEEIFWRMR